MIVSEAMRNLRSGTTRALTFGLICGVLATAALVADALAIDAVQGAAARYLESGAATLVVESPGGVDGARCEGMTDVPNVRAAGAIRQTDAPLMPLRTPGVELPTFDATPGAVALLRTTGGTRGSSQVTPRPDAPPEIDPHDDTADAGNDGVFVSAELADTLSLTTGSILRTGTGTAEVSGTFSYPDDGRAAGLGYSVVLSVPPRGAFDQCRVLIWPESDAVRAVVASSVLTAGASAESPPTIGQLNPTLGAHFDAGARFRDRPTALLPLAVIAAVGAAGFVAVRRRRLELAAARSVGVALRAQVAQIILETLAWAACAAAGALMVAAVCAAIVAPSAALDPASSLVVAVGTLLAAPAGAAIAVSSVSRARMHAYFRDR